MDSNRKHAIVETLRRVAKQEFDIEGNPWEPNPHEFRHMEVMLFARVDLPLAVQRRLSWKLSQEEREYLADRCRALVATSSYYRDLMAEVDDHQRQFNRPPADRVAALQRRGAAR